MNRFCASAAVPFVLSVLPGSARLLQDSTLALDEVAFSTEQSAVYLGSPSILRVRRTNTILYSHDRFGSGYDGEERNVTVFQSMLGVNSEPLGWQAVAMVPSQYWSNMWQLEGSDTDVFLLGTSTDGPAPIKIARSRDGGVSWFASDAAVLFGEVRGNASYETGPTPVVETKGRVYRAMERIRPPFDWGVDYEAVVISGPADPDALLDPSAWNISAPLPFDATWLQNNAHGWPIPDNPGFLEGNVVLGPDGETLYNLLRLSAGKENVPYYWGNTAILTRFDPVNNCLAFESVVDMPGDGSGMFPLANAFLSSCALISCTHTAFLIQMLAIPLFIRRTQQVRCEAGSERSAALREPYQPHR